MFARVARGLAEDKAPSAEMLAVVDRGWAAHEQLADVVSATQFDLMRAVEHAAEHDGTAAALDWYERHWPDHAPDPGKFDEAVKAWPGVEVEAGRGRGRERPAGRREPDSLEEVWRDYRLDRGYPPLHPL